MRIAIIGGGIAGLAAAYELEKARAAGAPVEYTLFEARERLGGSLASEIVDGAVLERGPDSFLTEKPAAAELCRELGLGGELIPSNDAARKTYIVVRNRLVPLPDGLMFLVPTKLIPTALTRLFSLTHQDAHGAGAAASAAAQRPATSRWPRWWSGTLARRPSTGWPIRCCRGIYGGDAAQLSARTVLPRLVEMETQVRLADARHAGRAPQDARHGAKRPQRKRPAQAASAAPRAIFTTLRGGMQQLVDALTARLDPASVRAGTPVSAHRERRRAAGALTAGGATESFDAVIMASPAWAAGALLAHGGRRAGRGAERHSLLLVDHRQPGLRRGASWPLPEGFGFLVPASRGPRDAGLHLCPSQVSGAHAAGQGGLARLSGRHEERSAADRDRTTRWWPPCAAS